MKRMTALQKQVGIILYFDRYPQPETAYRLGREMGFSTGRPLHDTLCALVEAGFLNYREDTLNTGDTAILFWLSEAGAEYARDLRRNG